MEAVMSTIWREATLLAESECDGKGGGEGIPTGE
jgi:hypothetical protein